MQRPFLFPLGLAKGEAFCNRVIERERLIKNFKTKQHTIITSPRRYGKSSLVLYALEESGILYEKIDLFVAINAKTIEEQILNGIKRLINKISYTPEQLIKFLKEYIKNLKSKWIIGTDGIHIELIPEKSSDSATIIMESLLTLEALLKKKSIKACFFIDEFQEIAVLANSKGIEGAIRHVAQECEYLTFVFSGSKRHLLLNMFNDRARPLYMLCDTLIIDRINKDEYTEHINKIAYKTWKKNLTSETLEEIFFSTERHPYYINALCARLWIDSSNTAPTKKDVIKAWLNYQLQEEPKVARELSNLSLSQRKLLVLIAHGANYELRGKASLHKLNLTASAVSKALQTLEAQDYLGSHSEKGFYLIDPLIKAVLLRIYSLDDIEG